MVSIQPSPKEFSNYFNTQINNYYLDFLKEVVFVSAFVVGILNFIEVKSL